MAIISLETKINANIEICFDLSRSIDLHQISTVRTKEKVIDGVTKGLINLDESVTWQATHVGIKQKLTSKITQYNGPFHFRDEQLKGAFKYIVHDHYFERKDGMTIMKDIFQFESPAWIIGKLFDRVFLTGYLRKFLTERNAIIKEYAETSKWRSLLNEADYK